MDPHPSMREIALALAFLVLAQVDTWSEMPAPTRSVTAGAAVVAAVALIWRVTHPTASSVVVLGAATASNLVAPSEGLWPIMAIILMSYSAGRHASTQRAVGILLGGLGFDLLTGVQGDPGSVGQHILNFVFIAVLMVGGPWVAGFLLRRSRHQSAVEADQAVHDERLRLARELHDVVGHSLGVIAVQAGAERATLAPGAPDSTRETLATIERTTRDALSEMRRLLAVMRDTDAGTSPRAPQPMLADLVDVVERARLAGWTAQLSVEGKPVPLPAGLELTAYRIVQEAVTNAVRHSDGRHLVVATRYEDGTLSLEVSDDGTADDGPAEEGYGLRGMRERAELYGGSCVAGPRPGGGFVVRADLPYEEALR